MGMFLGDRPVSAYFNGASASLPVQGVFLGGIQVFPTGAAAFSPNSIAGLQLWLDAADASTLFDATTGGSLVAANGAVGRWEDKSGNGRHATQGTANDRPLRHTAAVNGRDALYFDGLSPFLATSSFSLAQPFTYLAVVRPAEDFGELAYDNAFLADGASGGTRAQVRMLGSGTGLTSNLRINAGTNFTSSGAVFFPDTTVVVGAVFNGTSSSIRADGSLLATASTTAGTAGLNTGAQVGAARDGRNNFGGYISEVLYYSGTLSAGDLTALEAYLLSKWKP
jgi:hypothetical protein